MKQRQKRVMLTAWGLWGDGHWEVLAWPLAAEEDATSWGTFVGTSYAKGVTETTTQLVVNDGAKGWDQALYSHLSGVPHPRCLFHKIKNIAAPLQYADLLAEAGEPSSA